MGKYTVCVMSDPRDKLNKVMDLAMAGVLSPVKMEWIRSPGTTKQRTKFIVSAIGKGVANCNVFIWSPQTPNMSAALWK
jgi:hypothetical protein